MQKYKTKSNYNLYSAMYQQYEQLKCMNNYHIYGQHNMFQKKIGIIYMLVFYLRYLKFDVKRKQQQLI